MDITIKYLNMHVKWVLSSQTHLSILLWVLTLSLESLSKYATSLKMVFKQKLKHSADGKTVKSKKKKFFKETI